MTETTAQKLAGCIVTSGFLFFLLIISTAFIGGCYMNAEISEIEYIELNNLVEYHPGLKDVMDKFLDDDTIQRKEFNRIKALAAKKYLMRLKENVDNNSN